MNMDSCVYFKIIYIQLYVSHYDINIRVQIRVKEFQIDVALF
jgi:hypothetical protein